MNRGLATLLLSFFAGSWVSNLSIIRTTTVLLEASSLELILAVSSCAGLLFFALLRTLNLLPSTRLTSALLIVLWGLNPLLNFLYPEYPVLPALSALLFGELVKWHVYSLVLHRYGPLSAGRVLGWAVVAYEAGTVCAALSSNVPLPLLLKGLEVSALVALYAPLFIERGHEEHTHGHSAQGQLIPEGPLPWIMGLGIVAGFLKVSADTGFKFAVGLGGENVGGAVANFYLYSALFTLALAGLRRLHWLAPRLGAPARSLYGIASAQVIFALAIASGELSFLVLAAAFQRSVDKIFYQPTIQLLTSGFNPSVQEVFRRWHGTAFLAFGSFLGLVAFTAHGHLGNAATVLKGMGIAHLAFALLCFVMAKGVVKKILVALDLETKRAGTLGGSRAMAMLALLSPRHFLVHALLWSSRRGGMQGLPPEILQGLTAQAGGEVVSTFYDAFAKFDEHHQLALIRLAVFLDRKEDRAFLLAIAEEKLPAVTKARRLAAMHVVKVHGKIYRPLLRRSRGKKSPLPKPNKAA